MSVWANLSAAWRVAMGESQLEQKDISALADLISLYGGSKSGVTVSRDSALKVSTFLACARSIAQGIAQPPLKLMRLNSASNTRTEAVEHPLSRVLRLRANAWQTSFEYREMLGTHLAVTGNAYSFKNVVKGQIRELIPFEPQRVQVKPDEYGGLTYTYSAPNGATQTFPASSIWHLRGQSWCPWLGLDTVVLAREALGLSIVTEESHARMHANGVQSDGVYSVEGKLDGKQHAELREWIERNNAGPANKGKAMILDRSAKWIQQTMTGVDSQHLETRRYQIEEICRFMGVMPIMVGYSDKTATYASAEQMFLAHVVYTLSPWYARIEQSIDANLLSDNDIADGLYSNFVEEGLIRGSVKDTKDTILGYVNGGVMTPNEGRAKLDLNPDDDPASDELRIPVNVAQEPAATADPAEETPPGDAKVHRLPTRKENDGKA